MRISPAGIDEIKRHEALRLFAYRDPVGVLTIGWGHTGSDVREGQHITQSHADFLLREDLAWVEKAIADEVTVPLTQGQYDALCSWIFNVGAGAFKDSTLLEKLNARDYAGAAEQFKRWNKGTKNGVKVVLPGLVTRRAEETALFLSGTPAAEPVIEPPLVHLGPEPVAEPRRYDPPRPDQEPYVTEAAMPVPIVPIVSALAPAFLEMLPKLASWFSSGSKSSERNIAVVGEAIKLAQTTVGAVNAMDAVEKMQTDAAVRAKVEAAVEANWYQLTEAGGGGIAGARAADAAVMNSDGPWWAFVRSPSFWALALLLPLVYMVIGSIAGLWGYAEWSADVRASLATAVVSLVVGGAAGYYWGTSTSRNRSPAP